MNANLFPQVLAYEGSKESLNHNTIGFGFVPQPITSADFERLGIQGPSLYAAFLKGPDLYSVLSPLNEVLAANSPQPKAAENQWVFPLGGTPRAFLRVQYYVQPIAEREYDSEGPCSEVSVWGRVHAKEAEYLLEVGNGIFTTIAEWDTAKYLPPSLVHVESSGRPDYKQLGWNEKDILAWLGDEE